MAGILRQYSALAQTFNFAGISIEKGKGEDTFISVAKVEAGRFTVKAGVDGEVTRSFTGNNIHRVTLTLMATSRHNDELSAVHLLDVETDGAGIAPLMVRDRNGTGLLVEPFAFIEQFPDEEKAKEAGEVEWMFLCPDPKRFVGGNG